MKPARGKSDKSSAAARPDVFCVFRSGFRACCQGTAAITGSPWAFVTASLVIAVWLICGPFFHYSDTWQLIINTATTIITFLMVFLIQNTQNRDTKAIQLKLDELIRAVKGARNQFVNLENLTDDELTQLAEEFERVRRKAELKSKAAKASRL
ncbi:MAG TPA: low affinity iron permease family protein [Verrucomicrobiae bacterium]|jgi:low affinity Fe/Cu permease|nr:low affinity iron permease family protein [Verrucomicrobiae bacterium]